ncbi:unnamed protein product [Cochlearia groenlandica]
MYPQSPIHMFPEDRSHVTVQSHPPGTTSLVSSTTAYPRSPIQTDNDVIPQATQSHQKTFQHIPQDSIDNIPMHTDDHKNLNVDKPEQDCTPLRNETIHMDTDNHAPAEKEESRQLHNRSWVLADELEAVATPYAHPLLASITGAQGKVIAEGVDQSARQTMEIAAAINNVVIQASLLPTKESSANNSGWEECMVEVGKCVDNILAGSTSDAAKKIIQPIVLINSSPTHQKPRNIPTSLEVQLATILQIHTQHWTASRLTTTSYWTWQHPLPGYPHRSLKVAVDKNKLRVDRRITALVTQLGHVWIDDVDTVYVPMNWDNVHWVGHIALF